MEMPKQSTWAETRRKYMSDNTNLDDNVDAVDEGNTLTLEQVIAERDAARNDAAKHKKLAKDARVERDSLKAKTKEEGDENYKDLYQKANDRLAEMQTKIKTKEINSAVKDQLLKVGILPDAVEAAIKLIDSKLISYDDDTDSVDIFSIETAAKDLKSRMKFMFETKVANLDIRKASSGKDTDTKEMSRAEFNKLPLHSQRDAALKYNITD